MMNLGIGQVAMERLDESRLQYNRNYLIAFITVLYHASHDYLMHTVFLTGCSMPDWVGSVALAVIEFNLTFDFHHQIMARDNEFMDVDSDSDISIDGAYSASKNKGKAKATEKQRAVKSKAKPKDVVYSLDEVLRTWCSYESSKHTPGKHLIRVHGIPCKRTRLAACKVLWMTG